MTMNDADWSNHPCYKQDPLPDIEPALLNSLDIKRYVEKGCLLEEGSFDQDRMKPASYEMRFLGDLYDWQQVDGRLKKRCRKISEDDCIELSKNSISYLWIKERLQLPEYIAARFNLRIRDVHKGILLGTGPLIDPGFSGRLLIPLHNLTDNDYVLRGGKGIIWVEFTKVSKNDYWSSNGDDKVRPDGLVEFPTWKLIEDPDGYLGKAGAAGGVQSAFKGALDAAQGAAVEAKTAAEAARKRVKEVQTRTTRIAALGLLGVVAGVAALMLSAYQLSFPVREDVHNQGNRIGELERKLEDIEAQSKEPIAARAEEPGTASEVRDEATSEAPKPVQDSEIPQEPANSLSPEVAR